ncbi:MAG: metal ABC transporter substrate-binding protein [Candidatus Howiella sp.]|jgi:zinc transport system substrate-binding protein
MKFAKELRCFLACCLIGLLLAGCKAPEAAESGKLEVVASFAPVYALTLTIADGAEDLSVSCMAANSTGCLHDYQITADDMRRVEKADLYIIGGAGMEGSFLDKITAQYKNLTIADSSAGTALLEEDGGIVNPHIWLSTENAAVMAKNICAALSAASPENANVFEENLARFQEEAADIHAAYIDRFAALQQRRIITFHEAFEYLADEFGLEVEAVIETEPGTAPDPQTLSELIDTVKTGACNAIFTEPQYPDDTAQAISRETGVPVYTLDPIVTGEMTADSFLSTLRSDLDTLLSALA